MEEPQDIKTLRGLLGLSQRKAAEAYTHETGDYISNASVSLMENGEYEVREGYLKWLQKRNGMRTVEVEPCPDCGSVHVGRCHGKQGEVVIVGPGERVVRQGGGGSRREKRFGIDLPKDVGLYVNNVRIGQQKSWTQVGLEWAAMAPLLAYWGIDLAALVESRWPQEQPVTELVDEQV